MYKKNVIYKILLVSALMLGTFFLFGGKSEAASLSVAPGSDTVAVDGICGLTEAVTNLNDQANTNTDCSANGTYGTNDTITIAAGTITTPGGVCVKKSVVIVGAGRDETTINMTNPDGFIGLSVCGGIDEGDGTPQPLKESITYAQKDMTINNGIGVVVPYMDDTDNVITVSLTYERIKVTNCIYCMYPLITLGRDESSAVVMVKDTVVVAGAESFSGGFVGVAKNVTLTIENFATEGDFVAGLALSVTHPSAVVTVSNATIAGTQVPIAINNGGGGTVNLSNNTLVKQHFVADANDPLPSGLYITNGATNSEAVTINAKNMLLADNNDSNCLLSEAAGPWLTFNSLGGNLSDDGSCSALFTDTRDRNGLASLTASLGPLGSNGGNVPTVALLSGSPAIDAGVCDDAPTTDARGTTRPQGAGCDSGAYELGVNTNQAGVAAGGTQAGVAGKLADTGIVTISAVILLAVFIICLVFIYADYRRHKKPLVAIDPSIKYSLMHHMKVVTLPLFRYRLSIKVSKVNPLSKDGLHRF